MKVYFSLDELDEIPNHIQKFQNLKILKEKATRQRIHFLNHLKKKLFNGFKISSFKCKKYIFPKTMFGCPLKLILGIFGLLALNQNMHTQLCMNVKNHH
jgi:hypothetical protein